MWARLRERWRSAGSSLRWSAAVDAARTSPPLATALVALTVASALLPTAFALASGALVAALPETVARGMDSAAGQRAVVTLLALGAIFVAQQIVGPLRGLCVGEALGRRYMGHVHRRVMQAALRPTTVRHLERPELHDKVQQSLGGGNLGARVTGIGGVPPGLANWAAERLRGLAALLVIAHFSVWLALLLAIVWLHHLAKLQAVHNEVIAARLVRTPGMRHTYYVGGLLLATDAAKEVRVFGLGRWLGARFERAWLVEMADLWVKRRGLAPKLALANVPVLAAQVLAVALMGRAAVMGEMGLGALLVYVNGVLQSQAFGSVTDSDLTVQYGTAGLKPLAELERMVAEDPRLAPSGARPADGLPREAIRFEGVSFTYPGRTKPVFHNLTLHIPVGRSLAIVGVNGAGKTTLIKLLARLYDPDEGRITVDGVDLQEINASAWQRRVAAIFQDFVKFHLSAYDNVALGGLSATRGSERQAERQIVIEAARRAGALELIEGLPQGWETVLSRQYTGGADLSGGQWQRIGLARALFAARTGASLLVMDEPTAHLDVRAEAAFYDSFLDLTEGLTTILISHRFSTVRRADRIVVLEEAGVVEDGNHEALMRLGGRYASMFNLQAQRFSDEGPAQERQGK